MTLDLDRLDASVQRALDNHTCARLMPGELRELVRLARIGSAAETAVDLAATPASALNSGLAYTAG